MSQVATPAQRPAKPGAPPARTGEVSFPAAIVVSAVVFALVLCVLAYALHHGLQHDERALASHAREQVQRGEAVTAHVVTAGAAVDDAGAPGR